MKYYFIAGEASGDLHAANLIKSISVLDPDAEFRCLGGNLMKEAGAHLSVHYRDMALMGGLEVFLKYPVIRKNKNITKRDILAYKPDVLILVDYSGFNLPMARFAKGHDIKVFYYISPKLWAWGKWRIRSVRRFVDKMFVILPFEVDFYKDYYIDAEYYGNPVLDSIENFNKDRVSHLDFILKNKLDNKPIIAMLAGSRKQEIDLLLPEMLSVAGYYSDYQFVIAGAPSIPREYYHKFINGTAVGIVFNQTYSLLKNSVAAIVTSGTATLETALLNIPQVVVYKTSPVTFFIGSFFVRIKYFSLVNLILNKEVVKELLQQHLADDIKSELGRILMDKPYRQNMLIQFEALRRTLGIAGVSGRVAERMCQLLKRG